MRILIISDTHNKRIELPHADLLIHCGDHSSMGYERELIQFNKWMEEIKPNYKHGIILVPGNHDFLYEQNETLAKSLVPSVKVLIHESYEVEGIKIFGTPYQPIFGRWAFNKESEELDHLYSQIPSDIEILISHAPPYMILDQLDEYGSMPGAHVGSQELLRKLDDIKDLKLVCMGHIHCCNKMMEFKGIKFVNASICNELYKPIQPYHVIDL